MNIAVLGAGMVGRTIAVDLSKNHRVTSFDLRAENLALIDQRWGVEKRTCDLGTHDFSDFAAYDLVVSAVPGSIGYRTLESLINVRKNVVDISFFPEDPFSLSTLALKNNVTAVVDCGVAPGMSNFILGHCDKHMAIDTFHCVVGGLPKVRIKPFEYKAPFSPMDVIEEYTRPARYVENGFDVTKPALSDVEHIEFKTVGTLEAFNSDGLRTLITTMSHIPNMKEKTLRYPGHADLMRSLISSGFLNSEKGKDGMSPLEYNSKILFDQWKLNADDPEFTIMQIVLTGDGKRVTYNLFDENETTGTKFSSMSRTTGYACTAVVELLVQGLFTKKGLYAPESIGSNDECFSFVTKYLSDRNVLYEKTEEALL